MEKETTLWYAVVRMEKKNIHSIHLFQEWSAAKEAEEREARLYPKAKISIQVAFSN